jgi:hypothetical protein
LLGDTPVVITSTTTGTGASITVSDATFLSLGDILEWQTGTVGYEQMLVTVDPAGVNPITVQRGVNGTTAETHTSGDAIFVNPSFTGRQTQQAIGAGIRKLWPYVYIVTSCDLGTITTPKVWYDLVGAPSGTLGLVGVRQQYGASPAIYQGDYVLLGSHGGLPCSYDLSIDTAICATGFGVRFPGGFYDPVAHPFARVASPVLGVTDIVDSGRFPVADHLSYFAAGRLTGALEIPRVSTGGDLESSTTVSTGARSSAGGGFLQTAQDLLQTLGIRYRNLYRPLDVQ